MKLMKMYKKLSILFLTIGLFMTSNAQGQCEIVLGPDQIICEGNGANLTATISGVGDIEWFNGTTSIDTGASIYVFANVTTTYSAIYTETMGGCKDTAFVTVTVFPSLSLATTITDASCGVDNGVIMVTVFGGTAPFIYNLQGVTNNSTGIFNGLPPGNYQIEVTSSEGCVTTINATVNTPLPLPPATTNIISAPSPINAFPITFPPASSAKSPT